VLGSAGPIGLGLSVLGLVVVMDAGGARAQRSGPIERAESAFADGRFESARSQLRRVLSSPDLDPATALRAHRHLAGAEAALDEPERARVHALAAVALDPAVAPPNRESAVAALFEEARRQLRGTASQLVLEQRSEGGEHHVRARVEPFVPELVASIVLVCEPSLGPEDLGAEGPAAQGAVWSTTAPTFQCEATARTGNGAVMLTAHARYDTTAVAVPRAEPPPAVVEEDEGSSAWPWIAVGAGVAIALGVVAVLAFGSDRGAATDGNRLAGAVIEW
jgi:hypothetical protein